MGAKPINLEWQIKRTFLVLSAPRLKWSIGAPLADLNVIHAIIDILPNDLIWLKQLDVGCCCQFWVLAVDKYADWIWESLWVGKFEKIWKWVYDGIAKNPPQFERYLRAIRMPLRQKETLKSTLQWQSYVWREKKKTRDKTMTSPFSFNSCMHTGRKMWMVPSI